MILKSTLFVIASWFALSTASADTVAHYCTGPSSGPVEAIRPVNACTGYRVRGTSIQVSFPYTGSGSLVASADGRTVVMIQSYLYGSVDDVTGEIVELVGATEVKNPVGVYVYRDGKLVASHAIDDLVARKKLVGESISHVQWVRSAPKTIGATFTITTSDFRTITFDGKTGAIAKQEDSSEWKRCTIIASGKLDLKGNRLTKPYSLKTEKHVPDIAFLRGPGVALTDRASATVCLEQDAAGLVLTDAL
jgi:hypothetical protein